MGKTKSRSNKKAINLDEVKTKAKLRKKKIILLYIKL